MREITARKKLELMGLFVLARRHNAALKEIELAAAELVGEPEDAASTGYFGHVSDQVMSEEPDVDVLIRKLGIVVKE